MRKSFPGKSQALLLRSRNTTIQMHTVSYALMNKIGINDVEDAIVIPDRRGHDTISAVAGFNMEGIGRGQSISNLLPVGQVPAVKNRKPRIKFKTGTYKVKVVSNTADTWIRIISRDDRVF